MIAGEHHSPDNVLTLIIEDLGAGDAAIGFAQSPWHTHPDMLVPRWGSTPEAAGQAFVNAVLQSEAVIGVRRKDGVIVEAWITDDPEFDMDWISDGETFELRHWDGRPWSPRDAGRREPE